MTTIEQVPLKRQDIQPMPKGAEVWRHYKGGTYHIIAVAVDAGDLSMAVVYGELLDSGYLRMWVRPLSEFLSFVNDADGDRVPRFWKEM